MTVHREMLFLKLTLSHKLRISSDISWLLSFLNRYGFIILQHIEKLSTFSAEVLTVERDFLQRGKGESIESKIKQKEAHRKDKSLTAIDKGCVKGSQTNSHSVFPLFFKSTSSKSASKLLLIIVMRTFLSNFPVLSIVFLSAPTPSLSLYLFSFCISTLFYPFISSSDAKKRQK